MNVEPEPQICCCGIKVGAIVVAYVELVLVVIGAGIVIPSYLSLLNDYEYSGNAALTAEIVIACVELVAVLIGTIFVHVGVHNRRPLFLIPLLVINIIVMCAFVYSFVVSLINGVIPTAVGAVIDFCLFFFFTYVIFKCFQWLKHYGEGHVTVNYAVQPGQPGFYAPPAQQQQVIVQMQPQQYGGQVPPQQYGVQVPPQQYGAQMPPQQYGAQMPPQQYGAQMPPQPYGTEVPPPYKQ